MDFDLMDRYVSIHKEERMILKALYNNSFSYCGTLTEFAKYCGYEKTCTLKNGRTILNISTFRTQGTERAVKNGILKIHKENGLFTFSLRDDYKDKEMDFDLLDGYLRIHKEERMILKTLYNGSVHSSLTEFALLCGYENKYKTKQGKEVLNISTFRNQGINLAVKHGLINVTKNKSVFEFSLTPDYKNRLVILGKE